MYRDVARVYILDEPTAALDPIAEAKIYRNFATLTGDKTTILISHRLGITSVVDRILVFDKGKIIEDGNHEELMFRNGLYSKMYNADNMAKTSTDLVKYAQKALTEKWGYCLGTFGQTLTQSLLSQKCSQGNGVGSYNTSHKAYLNSFVGKRISDCYGLVKGFVWTTGDGQPVYSAAQYRNQEGAYSATKEKGAINTIPEIPGIILWMKGHARIYIGNGEFIECVGCPVGMRKGTKINVIMTAVVLPLAGLMLKHYDSKSRKRYEAEPEFNRYLLWGMESIGSLAEANAISIINGCANGEIDDALEEFNKFHAALERFTQKQAASTL